MIPPLINVKHLSEHLDIREKTLYTWARQGRIPSYRINGLVRFNLEEVQEILERVNGQS